MNFKYVANPEVHSI